MTLWQTLSLSCQQLATSTSMPANSWWHQPSSELISRCVHTQDDLRTAPARSTIVKVALLLCAAVVLAVACVVSTLKMMSRWDLDDRLLSLWDPVCLLSMALSISFIAFRAAPHFSVIRCANGMSPYQLFGASWSSHPVQNKLQDMLLVSLNTCGRQEVTSL